MNPVGDEVVMLNLNNSVLALWIQIVQPKLYEIFLFIGVRVVELNQGLKINAFIAVETKSQSERRNLFESQ